MRARLVQDIKNNFGEDILEEGTDEIVFSLKPDRIFKILAHLKETHSFDMLTDLTAIDYFEKSPKEKRFSVLYILTSLKHNFTFTIEVRLPETNPKIDSCVLLWKNANWLEREAFDMFGIEFNGHPNLKRILYPEEYTEFPMRKEFAVNQRRE